MSEQYQLGWPVLRLGNDMHPEESLELLLRAQSREVEQLAGFADLRIQKYFDALVQYGIRILQGATGAKVDGIVGPKTWPRLILTVKKGDEGDAVRAVQCENQYRNMASPEEALGLATDGIFGPKTDHWVRGFQGATDLKPDGIVGVKTWQQLVAGALAG